MGAAPSGRANRGRALEELVKAANEAYRRRGVAVIHKVPTEWIPLRDRAGKIVGAKVERKAAVDFLGHVRVPGKDFAVPLAFDVKEVARGTRWPLAKLPLHQYEYLRDCSASGCAAFVLVAFWEPMRFYAVPFAELAKRVGPSRRSSIAAGDPGLVEVSFPDYLDGVLGALEVFLLGGNEDACADTLPRRNGCRALPGQRARRSGAGGGGGAFAGR
ncbi:MAG: Holliday junction resolvase RecU [Moorellales bacterium]